MSSFLDDKDLTIYFLNSKLNSMSVYFDIGTHHGEFVDVINEKFHCNIFCFEPIREFYQFLLKKYENNKNIQLFNFALLNDNCQACMNNLDDGSTLFSFLEVHRYKFRGQEIVKVIDIFDFFLDHRINKVDLMKINIEGSEFLLLDRMIETHIIEFVEQLIIQFHWIYDEKGKRERCICEKLMNTHKLVWEAEHQLSKWIIK